FGLREGWGLQVEPPKHCGICACTSHYTDECPQLQEDHAIAATHNFYDQPSSTTNNQGWRNNQAPRWNQSNKPNQSSQTYRQQPSQPHQSPHTYQNQTSYNNNQPQ
ncbi:hypothetical protein PIB30_082359, partial [Stylosanthes scabra]|nr:hypothetical protein [Stylosanthes scabra]